MENILIDTDVVIEYLRSKDKSSTELIKLLQEHDVFLSSISEFELFLGAKTDCHQNDLEMLFSEVDVIPFDFGCGKIAANLWKDLQLMHQHLEIKDIFIASIAINNGLWLQTFNKKHFQRIKKLKIWEYLLEFVILKWLSKDVPKGLIIWNMCQVTRGCI